MNTEFYKEYVTALVQVHKNKEPDMYQVLMLNDDFTPMEFVVGILEMFFQMDRCRAAEIMLEVHNKGKAACGLYTKDIAESKISQVIAYARMNEYPLLCDMEPVRC